MGDQSQLGGGERIRVVSATAWVVAIFLFVDPVQDRFPSGEWIPFFLIGPGPILVFLSWKWIQSGYKLERLSGKNLPKRLYKQIENYLLKEHKIIIKAYVADEIKMEHVFTIAQGKATGRLVFARQFLAEHTDLGVMERISSFEVKRQLGDFDEKRIVILNRSVVVELL